MSNNPISQNQLYGKTILSNAHTSNDNTNIYKKMKNKVKYGNSSRGLLNNGKRKVVK